MAANRGNQQRNPNTIHPGELLTKSARKTVSLGNPGQNSVGANITPAVDELGIEAEERTRICVYEHGVWIPYSRENGDGGDRR